jgi:hypothetical protein
MSTFKSPCPICKKVGHNAMNCWYKKSATVCNYCAGNHLVADCKKLSDAYCTRCDRAGHTVALCRARPCWTCNSIKFHDWRACEQNFKNLHQFRKTRPRSEFEFSDHEHQFTHEDIPYIPMDQHAQASCYGVWSFPRQREFSRRFERDVPPLRQCEPMRFASPRDFQGPVRQLIQPAFHGDKTWHSPQRRQTVREHRSYFSPNVHTNEPPQRQKRFRETVARNKVRVFLKNAYSFI